MIHKRYSKLDPQTLLGIGHKHYSKLTHKRYSKNDLQTILKKGSQALQKLLKIDPQMLIYTNVTQNWPANVFQIDPQTLLKTDSQS